MPSAEEFGPYIVHEQIGLGGMATVHRAETQGIAGFSKQVALKRMLPSVASNASLVKSFIREARLASHLRHANVAQTYDLGKVGDTYFIAMELVPGRNLREILKHCAAVAGHMPLPIVLNIVSQICDALDYAHNLCDDSGQPLGIIHRDVSPSNIIVSEGGIVKLIDFGIAKASGSGMTTMSGTIKGKFGYMAPEYLMGFIDARADLFAAGVIAHELMSNRPLFQGKDDMDTMFRVKDMKIDPPSRKNPKVPPEIDRVIMTALDRDPEQRWQRANAMRTALASEIKRLKLHAHNNEVIDWIDGAFHQSERFNVDSEPVISVSGTTEMPAGSVPDEFLTASDSLQTMVKPSGSKPIQAQQTDWKFPSDVSTQKPLPNRDSARSLDRPVHHGDPSQFDVKTTPDQPSATYSAANEPAEVDWKAQSNAVTNDRRSSPMQSQAERLAAEPTFDAPTMSDRPSQQQKVARPSSPALRPSSPALRPSSPALRPSPPPLRPSSPGPRSAPQPVQQLPPVGSVPSGARTAPRPASPASTLLGIGDVLADLEDNSSVAAHNRHAKAAGSAVSTKVEASGGASNFLLAVLVVIAAGGAAAVVYFALPYLT